MALAHHGAGGGVLVLVPLNALAVDQVGDVEQHLAAFGEATADLFVQRIEHAVHLEADGAGAGLAFALAGGAFAEVGEIFLAHALERVMLFKFLATAVVDVDLEMHLGLAVQAFEVVLELALVGADGLSEALVVLKDGSKTEREDGGLLEAVGDYPSMVHAGFLIHRFGWVMFADYDSEVTGGVEENLVTTYSKYGFKWNWFAMAG